eukprot:gene10923-7580_t
MWFKIPAYAAPPTHTSSSSLYTYTHTCGPLFINAPCTHTHIHSYFFFITTNYSILFYTFFNKEIHLSVSVSIYMCMYMKEAFSEYGSTQHHSHNHNKGEDIEYPHSLFWRSGD